ncbi:MAG TPA: TonB-dependent siderophore receptor [Edaphobacter sp.]|nr:TonB-dependent siderophore receptor [Edaphobacter sp.]
MKRAVDCLIFRVDPIRFFLLVAVLASPLAGRSQALGASGAAVECRGTRYAVTGSIADTSGGLIPFARVKASCGELSQETRADERGEYHFSLAPGEYQLEVTAEGYSSRTEALQVRGSAGQIAPVVTLSIAAQSSSVTVSAEGMTSSFAPTSTKVDTPLLEQPFSIDTITRDQIIQRNPQSVADTIGYTAGAQTLSVNGPAVMAVDSFSLRGSAADEYLDGMRIPQSFNAVQSGPGSLQLDPNDMERVDLLLGPSSTLYGQSNLGGIVDAISKQPTATPYRSLQFQAGSYNRFQGSGDFSGPLVHSGALQYRINGLIRRSDTYVYGIQDNRLTVNPTITWHPSLNTAVTLYAKYLRNTSDSITAYIPAVGSVSPASFGYLPVSINLSNPTYDRYKKNQFFTGYSVDHRSPGRWTVRHQLRYVRMNANWHFLYLTGVQPDGVTANRANTMSLPRIEGVQTDTHASTTLRTGRIRHTLLGGMDFQWQRYRNVQGFVTGSTINMTRPVYGPGDTIPAASVNQRQSQFQGGLYGQEQMEVAHFTVVAGGRVDFTAQDTFDNLANRALTSQRPHAFSGHAGVSYHIAGFAPYFSYSTSFLPTLGADVTGKPFIPVTGSNVEGGVKYQFTRVPLMLRVAGFSLRQQNTLQPNPVAPTTSIQTGEVHTPGAEVQASGSVLRSLDYTVAFTHIEPRNTISTLYQGKQPVTVANNSASTWLHYTIRRGLPTGLGFGGGARFTGASWGTVANNLRVNGFTVFDTAVDYTLERWRFAVNATNVGNRRYVNGCSNIYFCAYGQARTVIGTASFNF